MPLTEVGQEDVAILNWVSCICYLIRFKKSKVQVQAILDSGSEVNAMTLRYTSKLGLKVRITNVGAQKIDDSTCKMFGMVLASFQVEDTLGKAWFFQKIFLLADLNIEVVEKMPFLTFNIADIKFAKKNLPEGLTPPPRPYRPPSGSKSLTRRNLLKRRWISTLKFL